MCKVVDGSKTDSCIFNYLVIKTPTMALNLEPRTMAPDRVEHQNQRAGSLRAAIHAFVRRFGLLDPSRTPCGQPLPVTQAHALMELLGSPAMTHGELGGRLALSKRTVSRMVARIEEQGWLRQERDDADRRIVRLCLTVKGRRLARRINDRSLERFSGMVERLPAMTFETVMESLDRLTRATSQPDELDDGTRGA